MKDIWLGVFWGCFFVIAACAMWLLMMAFNYYRPLCFAVLAVAVLGIVTAHKHCDR